MSEGIRNGLALLGVAAICLVISLATGSAVDASTTQAGLSGVLRGLAVLLAVVGLVLLVVDLLRRKG